MHSSLQKSRLIESIRLRLFAVRTISFVVSGLTLIAIHQGRPSWSGSAAHQGRRYGLSQPACALSCAAPLRAAGASYQQVSAIHLELSSWLSSLSAPYTCRIRSLDHRITSPVRCRSIAVPHSLSQQWLCRQRQLRSVIHSQLAACSLVAEITCT